MAESNFGVTVTFEGDSIGDVDVATAPDDTSPAIAFRTHASGALRRIPSKTSEAGDAIFRLVVTWAELNAIKTAKEAETIGEFVVTFPSHKYTFDGFYSGITQEQSDAMSPDVVRATVTVSVDGAVAYAETT